MRALLLLSLALSSPALAADSLDCDLTRGERSLPLSSALNESTATTATKEANELLLGADSSLSPGSYIVVLQDDEKQVRAAFTGSPEAVAFAGSALRTKESAIACRSRIENPPKVMPNRAALPDYLVCVVDSVKIENGAVTESTRVLKRIVSTPLINLPQAIGAETAESSFSIRLHRMDFRSGLDVVLTDKRTGAFTRFTGPAGTLRTSFMMGLTQGNRASNATFLRLGCVFTADPKSLD